MVLKETRIPVSSLRASENFYKEVFSESPREEEGLLVFSNGLVLYPFSLWNAGHRLEEGTAVKPCLSSHLVFETDFFDSFLRHLEENESLSSAICSRELLGGRPSVTLIDPDLNFITFRSSGRLEAKLSDSVVEGVGEVDLRSTLSLKEKN